MYDQPIIDDPCDDIPLDTLRLWVMPPMVADIQRAVAKLFRIPSRTMTSQDRHREVARPRQVAMYLARRFTRRSLPEIGRRFGGRDHSTVCHAIRQIETLRRIDPELDADVRQLERHFQGAA